MENQYYCGTLHLSFLTTGSSGLFEIEPHTLPMDKRKAPMAFRTIIRRYAEYHGRMAGQMIYTSLRTTTPVTPCPDTYHIKLRLGQTLVPQQRKQPPPVTSDQKSQVDSTTTWGVLSPGRRRGGLGAAACEASCRCKAKGTFGGLSGRPAVVRMAKRVLRCMKVKW